MMKFKVNVVIVGGINAVPFQVTFVSNVSSVWRLANWMRCVPA